jgi:two-component system sensor histidine kinase PilS (NtrC family)
LRESILVVDAQDRIRRHQWLGGTAAERWLSEAWHAAGRGSSQTAVLARYLASQSYDQQSSTLSLLSAQGYCHDQPHFVSLETEDNGPTLIFLEDTTMIAERVQQSKLAALGRLSAVSRTKSAIPSVP